MSKKRVKGHKANSVLNGEWVSHARSFGKKIAAGKRRIWDKKIIKEGEREYIERTDESHEDTIEQNPEMQIK